MVDSNHEIRREGLTLDKWKMYDKILQTNDSIEEGLSKASSVLAGINYISNDKVRNTVKGLNIAVGVGMVAHTIFQYVREAQEESLYSLSVNDLDEHTFDVASELLEEFQEEQSVRSFTIRTKFDSIPLSNKTRRVLLTDTDQDSVVRFNYSGHQYQGHLTIPEPPTKSEKNSGASVIGIRKITFYCKKSGGIKALQDELQRRVDARALEGVKPLIYVNGDYGFNSSELRTRPLESIILKEGQVESVVEHIEKFLSYEKLHNEFGLPYHTGILLKGPPGTGKTSLTAGLASHFQVNIYQISLSNIESDADLNDIFSGIQPRSIVVLEDLDVLGSTSITDREAERDEDSITMSGLLNVLDGNMTPHGMILVATTNNADNIDPAITRRGRIDKTLTLDYMDNAQLERLIKFFTGKTFKVPTITPADKITSSDVSGIFRTYLDNPENAIGEVVDMIEEKKVMSIAELG